MKLSFEEIISAFFKEARLICQYAKRIVIASTK
jgi:hypothetical protein